MSDSDSSSEDEIAKRLAGASGLTVSFTGHQIRMDKIQHKKNQKAPLPKLSKKDSFRKVRSKFDSIVAAERAASKPKPKISKRADKARRDKAERPSQRALQNRLFQQLAGGLQFEDQDGSSSSDSRGMGSSTGNAPSNKMQDDSSSDEGGGMTMFSSHVQKSSKPETKKKKKNASKGSGDAAGIEDWLFGAIKAAKPGDTKKKKKKKQKSTSSKQQPFEAAQPEAKAKAVKPSKRKRDVAAVAPQNMLRVFLTSVGCEEYEQNCTKEDVDFKTLLMLDKEEVPELFQGISFGKKKRLWKALEAHKADPKGALATLIGTTNADASASAPAVVVAPAPAKKRSKPAPAPQVQVDSDSSSSSDSDEQLQSGAQQRKVAAKADLLEQVARIKSQSAAGTLRKPAPTVAMDNGAGDSSSSNSSSSDEDDSKPPVIQQRAKAKPQQRTKQQPQKKQNLKQREPKVVAPTDDSSSSSSSEDDESSDGEDLARPVAPPKQKPTHRASTKQQFAIPPGDREVALAEKLRRGVPYL